jgi:7-cyano-7-deazaguanine reductase
MAKIAAGPASAATPARTRGAASPNRTSAKTPALNERQPPATPPSAPTRDLQVFDNPSPQRDYLIQFQVPEFTCHCPLTGQPDFAHFTIDMIADRLCIELKSLKMYFWSFRNEGAFHEKVTNTILDDIVAASAPRFIRITAKWYVRGGIYTNVIAEHRQKGWKPQPTVDLPAMTMERGLLG